MAEQKTILAKAKAWATKKNLFGAQAFMRFVILCFTENLNQVSDDFVFKGGNLLWVYIGTPRATIDLDLTTLETDSHAKVRQFLEMACELNSEIGFSLHSFDEKEQAGKRRAVATIAYSTKQGATNRFNIDLVYAIQADSHEIESPIHSELKIRCATIENIIADKLAACHQYKSGNTRMKDYDDLWRLSQTKVTINHRKLAQLLKSRKVPARIDTKWIFSDFESAWSVHRSRYSDLPEKLSSLFSSVNKWLESEV